MPELSTLIPIIIGVVITIAVIVALFAMIKTANGNEALVVSGVGATDKNGNPTIKRAGGRVVIPFIQKTSPKVAVELTLLNRDSEPIKTHKNYTPGRPGVF